MNCGTKEQTDAHHSSSIFSVGLQLKSGTDSFPPALKRACIRFQPPASVHIIIIGVDFHFVSDEGERRGGRAKHAQGGWSETGVSFSGGKQTHTGSRHGCHISLSSPVTPEGSGEGGNLIAAAVMPRGKKTNNNKKHQLVPVRGQKYMTGLTCRRV